VFRELAVVTVGLEANASYEVDHHWNAALNAGVRREQLEQLRAFETVDCFNAEERSVIRLAKEMTLDGRVMRQRFCLHCGHSFPDPEGRGGTSIHSPEATQPRHS
jgi:alkylhydroperoxidase family enzyme